MKGKLYGVGVGPGDPELLTLKAVRVMREVSAIALPASGSDSVVMAIAGQFLDSSKTFCVVMPMTRETGELRKAHDEAFKFIKAKLDEGDVAFLTLGDPSVYSTFTPLQKRALEAGYECEAVPGVPSFCAVAAKLQKPLAVRDQRLTVLSAPYDLGIPEGNVVIMKVGRHFGRVVDELSGQGRLRDAAMVEKCCMEGEKVHMELTEAPQSYFSTMIVGAGEETQ